MPFVHRILSLQFDNNNTWFVIAFSWQWQIIVVDCCSGTAVVVDCCSLIVLFFPFVVELVPARIAVLVDCHSLIVLFSFFCSRHRALPSSGLNDAYKRKRDQDCCCSQLSPPDFLCSFRFFSRRCALPSSGLNDAYKVTK